MALSFQSGHHNWISFLKRQYTYNDGSTIRICDWVSDIIRVAIVPELIKKQYVLSVNIHELITCVLNTLYHGERAYYKSQFNRYRCVHKKGSDYTPEQYEFFEEMLPQNVWDTLRLEFEIDHLSDAGLFADRAWFDIQYCVFSHIDFAKSHANKIMEERFRCIEDDEEDEEEHL